jgi:3-hydroxyisobutyrate dehydrogenase-like beta-hydroxyacid dehydrogenase
LANITFLGTGLLGGAFAEGAAKRGDTVTAWNRSQDKVAALAQFGVKPAATPADAVRGAARVHIVLKDDAVVEEVIAAARPGLGADAVVIDHTTTLPELTAQRSRRLNAEGIRYLHCPVFMGPPAARDAKGSMLVAGPKALFESVQAELSAMTGRVEYLGERADLAAINKLFGNAMIISVSAAMADILTLAQAGSVPPQDAVKLLGLLDINAMVAGRGGNMAKGNFAPSFELAMARKDVRLMLETAGDRPMAVLPGIAARMDQLIAAGHGAKDASVIGIDAVRPA